MPVMYSNGVMQKQEPLNGGQGWGSKKEQAELSHKVDKMHLNECVSSCPWSDWDTPIVSTGRMGDSPWIKEENEKRPSWENV